MTLREALTRATSQLSANRALAPTALADATLLLLHVLGIDRATLRAHPDRTLSRDQQARYQALLNRRLAFEPLQYILGTQEFYGLPLRVTPAVLIPRPETELLVESVLHHFAPSTTSPLRIADVGTGSGAIALALAHHLPHAHLTALDVSPAALEIARENAQTLGLAQRVTLLQSDLLAALLPPEENTRSVQNRMKYDAIVSNPPYIPTTEAPELHPQVRDHEPALALFAGPDGLDLYRRLIPQAYDLLAPGGLLALELGHDQQPALTQLLAAWQNIRFLPDLQGIPRTALALHP